jgi:hypothetical protein
LLWRNRMQIENVCDFDHDRFGKWVVVFFGHYVSCFVL